MTPSFLLLLIGPALLLTGCGQVTPPMGANASMPTPEPTRDATSPPQPAFAVTGVDMGGCGLYGPANLALPLQSMVAETSDLLDGRHRLAQGLCTAESRAPAPGAPRDMEGGQCTVADIRHGLASEVDAPLGCTMRLGSWKELQDAWPQDQYRLGYLRYNASELAGVLATPAHGNGLLALAHQVIVTRLIRTAGADTAAVDGLLAEADEIIGFGVVPPVGTAWVDLSSTSVLVDDLAAFNEDVIGPGPCTH